ncbi:uncharacterized protein LOC134824395 [Bolinopsis microptera]|uniref:uncharacterized protein LOC134824395 n=1 Tax=Bolinopsis microptera TaxID=2820187 RepID=UPI00307A9AEF
MSPHTKTDTPTSGTTGTGTFTASAGPKSTFGAGSSKTGKSRGSSRRRRNKEKLVEKKWMIFEPPSEDEPYPGMTIVDTKEGVIEAFEKINHYLKPRVKQATREIFVSFGGHNISRDGFISLIAVTEGNGITYLFDLITLENELWDNGMRDFLEIPYNEKVVFDTREVKDCLTNNHGFVYKGMFDLRIIEVMQRGKVKTYKGLPHEKIEKGGITKTVVSKTFLFKIDDIFTYYVKPSEREEMKYIEEKLEEKTWRSRKNGIENNCQRWVFEYQKFLITLWRNYKFGTIQQDKLWWISSELYNALFHDKDLRTYNKFEVNNLVPKFVLCVGTTDQPLGGVRCVKCFRMMPSTEFTQAMIRNRSICACTNCVLMASDNIKQPKATAKPPKKKKKTKKKKVRIAGGDPGGDSSSGISAAGGDSSGDEKDSK